MTEIMPVPRNLILLSYQQGAFALLFLYIIAWQEKPHLTARLFGAFAPFALAGRPHIQMEKTRRMGSNIRRSRPRCAHSSGVTAWLLSRMPSMSSSRLSMALAP